MPDFEMAIKPATEPMDVDNMEKENNRASTESCRELVAQGLAFPGTLLADGTFAVEYHDIDNKKIRRQQLVDLCTRYNLTRSANMSSLRASLRNFSSNRALWESLKGNNRRAHIGPTGKSKAAGPRQKTLQRREALVESSASHSEMHKFSPSTVFPTDTPTKRWNQAQHMADLQRALFIVRKYPYQVKEVREKKATERANGTSAQVQKLVRQGVEDANAKLNMLVDHLNMSPDAMPSFVSTSGHPSHPSQPNEPAWITTSFHSIPPQPPVLPQSLAKHHPTRTITLAGQFKLSFMETDVPHAPSISFADDLTTLNSMWDDTSSYWKGHSVLMVKNFPIAIVYWKQVYTSKSGKNWKPGQWKILKGRYFEWRVLVERYRRGTPEEFWSTFSTNGNRWNYKTILGHLAEERALQNKLDADAARKEYGSDFSRVFSYNRKGVHCVKIKDSDIAKQYQALKQGETSIREDDDE